MHRLYDSNCFAVTEMNGGESIHACAGFEILDKRSGKEVFLNGPWAQVFQQHVALWKYSMPSPDEVDGTRDSYTTLVSPHAALVLH